jgi:predicted alpha-1,6-mannanase (GH76 family)
MTDITPATLWQTRADTLQASLDHFYGAPWPQLFDNAHPSVEGGNATFNYWWLAHAIDARLDAQGRDPEASADWLGQAVTIYRNILERNDGSLFNDYFDDMLWYALAIVRLFEASGERHYLDDAIAIWEHVTEFGWNGQQGASLAWRKQQLYYKNTPANGPFVILGCRLSRLDDRPDAPDYLGYARTAFDWLTDTLVDPRTGFVEDGINREEDGRVDTQWRFTYNQGLYVGAAVELARTGAPDSAALIASAVRTAGTAIAELARDGVFIDEGDGGDEGLFKGVYYRYLGLLLEELREDSPERRRLEDFVVTSTDALWSRAHDGEFLLAANDWTTDATGTVPYSTELSAIMATELRAAIELRREAGAVSEARPEVSSRSV